MFVVVVRAWWRFSPESLRVGRARLTDLGLLRKLTRLLPNAVKIEQLLPGTKLRQLFGSDKTWSFSNPSLAMFDSESVFVVANKHNHLISPFRYYGSRRGVGLPTLVFSRLSFPEIAKMSVWKEIPAFEQPAKISRSDARFVRAGDGGFLLYSSQKDDGPAEMTTMQIGRDFSTFGEEIVMKSPLGRPVEKNWTPIELQFGSNTLLAYSPDFADSPELGSNFAKVYSHLEPISSDTPLRGGSPWVSLPSGLFVSIAHHTYLKPFRHYTHRVLVGRLDGSRLEVVAVTPEFCFRSTIDAEFCTGLTTAEGRVLVTFGFRNSQGWLAEIPLATIEKLFEGTKSDWNT